MAEGRKDNPAVLTVTLRAWAVPCTELSRVPEQAALFSLRPTIVCLYAQINRHTWEVYFWVYGCCKTSRNSFKLRKICCQEVTSKVLVAGPRNPAVFQAVLWRFASFPPGGGSRWTTSHGLFFTFQTLFQCPSLPVNPSKGSIPMGEFKIMIPTWNVQERFL